MWWNLMGKEVEIQANGITYRGKLVQVDENEVHLQTTMGWIVIQTGQITSMSESK